MSQPDDLSEGEVNEKPWKYIGYRTFSRLISAADDLFILRRFGTLTARALLALQDEIVVLEEMLEQLETAVSRRDAPDAHNGSFREENSTHAQACRASGKTESPVKDIKSVADWVTDKANAILDAEIEYVSKSTNHADLFAMVPKKDSPVRKVLERSSWFRQWSIWQIPSQLNEPTVTFASDRHIDAFVTASIVAIGLVMLVAPLWILAVYAQSFQRLGVITASLVVFLVFISSTNADRPLEVLVAAAAYAAILVVFMQIPPN
ncbi:hypothetical protein Slin15195_G109690 [Septoria linicola]|uniref:DUF6594 domain-containing protein n=1 Tax=Septoria linicola TaxID=215465 RepID=A0A9Q9AYW1_9PEZI|nr:hypothetical protein Slin14017_G108040 [Septoria linicola]USW57650.1 hypothetical protein Slin15195_G109690 [Septoria linicola]